MLHASSVRIDLLTQYLIGPLHEGHQVLGRNETRVLAFQIGFFDRTGPRTGRSYMDGNPVLHRLRHRLS